MLGFTTNARRHEEKMFGFAGILVGPIFGIGLSQLFRPQTPAFQGAWVGMLVGIAGFSIFGVILVALRNRFPRPSTPILNP